MEDKIAKRKRVIVEGTGTGGQEPETFTGQGNQNADKRIPEHPLLNQVVLKRIFQYLQPTGNLETLKSIRLVCSTWNSESLNWWRKLAVLKLLSEHEFLDEPVMMTGGITPSDLFKEMQDPASSLLEKPFEKYKFEGTTISIPFAGMNGSRSNLFWNLVGAHIKHLILDRVNFTGVKDKVNRFSSDLMGFLLTHVPDLEHLEVRNIRVNGQNCNPNSSAEDYEETPRINFRHTALVHPQILSLEVDEFTGLQLANFPNVQQVVRKMRDPETMPDLLLLSGTGPWTNSTVKTLDLMQAPLTIVTDTSLSKMVHFSCLQRLSICFESAASPEESFILSTLLLAHSGTLQVLEICRSFLLDIWDDFPFGVGMDALKELRLWGNVTQDLAFLRLTPNLQMLLMDLRGSDKRKYLRDSLEDEMKNNGEAKYYGVYYTIPCDSDLMGVELANLESVHINHEFKLEDLRMLGNCMPNIKVLKTVLGRGSINVICEQWPLLEQLEGLHGSSVSDEDILDLVKFKYLKSLHLNARCDEGELTDVAATMGFVKMRELTNLQVCVSPKFTKEMEATLQDCIQNVKIIRNYSDNDNHVDWECCRNEEYLQVLNDEWDSEYSEEDEEDV